MAKVRLEKITKRYQEVSAIEDITFEVPDGQFWVLVGPSGCGKSTIMRAIAGLETATSGNLYIGDELVNKIPARQRDVAMVFQNYALYPHKTVGENLAFGLKMRKVEPSIIRDRVEKVARSLSIERLLDRKPKQLSGGQQQRVALGRAIAREPKVFLLDEPLSNLDAQLRDDTRAELKQLHQRLGITTIYVTHDQIEAMTLGERIVVLNGGIIQQIGSPQQIYSRPTNRAIATFIGNPPMNILPAIYGNSLFWVGSQSLTCPPAIREKLQPTDGQAFDLGIRPENIELKNGSNRVNKDRLERDLWALDKVPIEVEIKVVEPLGKETLIRAGLVSTKEGLEGRDLLFPVAADMRFRPGDLLTVKLDFDRLFIFDPSTGEAVYP